MPYIWYYTSGFGNNRRISSSAALTIDLMYRSFHYSALTNDGAEICRKRNNKPVWFIVTFAVL